MLQTEGISCILLAQDGTSSAPWGLHRARPVDGHLPAVRARPEMLTVPSLLFVLLVKASGKVFGLCSVLPVFVF